MSLVHHLVALAVVELQAQRLAKLVIHGATSIDAAAAHEGVSLLLVASRGLTGPRPLGSVTERLVHHAPCSLLVLRPEDIRR